ncbi:lipoprotein insertase outer membrane protein LolB [Vibrio aphrogenes]|uniref:lipoprotein insertase outer membrane protein LolB n=1 Tax=Vibrio aphrogenes TaxID=1891186 RepID=UPI000B35C839|nr:lipoprotein insertase outer membrane protein LolB [Vibrio aphrogenes]
MSSFFSLSDSQLALTLGFNKSSFISQAYRHWFATSLAALMLLITGCSSVPPSQENYSVDWQIQKHKLEQLNTFKATGKIGYTDPEHRQSLSFIFKQAASYNELKLLSLFGQTVLTVQMMPSGAMITTSDGQIQTAKQADQLIKNLTGLAIPVSQLPDWLKGLPTNADTITFNQSNTVEHLEKTMDNKNWSLNYQSYQSVESPSFEKGQSSITLPKQMLLQQNETTIKILISKWII